MTTYKIDYCNGFFFTVDAEDLKEAIEKLWKVQHTPNVMLRSEMKIIMQSQ